jgi:beta-lactamase class A
MTGRFRIFILTIILLLAGFGAGWESFNYYRASRVADETQQVRQKGIYKFINPLYECEVNGKEYLKKYVPFENRIKERVANEIQKQDNMQLSMYFRNLNNGPSFGINETENFAPASLLKVPLMIAYFKKAETTPGILSQNIIFNPTSEDRLEAMQQIVPTIRLEPATSYSVEELIRRMIVYSDNEAMALLTMHIGTNDLYQIYGDLGINNPYGQSGNDVLSVKDYASFYRILYNAAYLNQADSEKALSLLAESDFRGGLPGGVPDNIIVAHKFGERELGEEEKYSEQFHDCGIIYYEKYPYLLCVMTRGNDMSEQISAIREVSRITFEEVSRNYP